MKLFQTQDIMHAFERWPLSLAALLRQRWWSSQLVEQKSHFWISFMRRFLSMVQQFLSLDWLEPDMSASLGYWLAKLTT